MSEKQAATGQGCQVCYQAPRSVHVGKPAAGRWGTNDEPSTAEVRFSHHSQPLTARALRRHAPCLTQVVALSGSPLHQLMHSVGCSVSGDLGNPPHPALASESGEPLLQVDM